MTKRVCRAFRLTKAGQEYLASGAQAHVYDRRISCHAYRVTDKGRAYIDNIWNDPFSAEQVEKAVALG